jgi:hypothetical protein
METLLLDWWCWAFAQGVIERFERAAATVVQLIDWEIWWLDWWTTWQAMFHGTHIA